MLDSLPRAAPRSPLHGQHHQVEGVHRLDLQPARAAAARLVRRGRRLRHHPFVAGGQRDVQEACAAAASDGRSAGRRGDSAGTIASRAASRSSVGSSSRSTPSRCRMSKKNTESGWAARAAATSTLGPRSAAAAPNRDAVTWNRCGRPSGAARSPRRRRSDRSPAAPASRPPPRAAGRSRRRGCGCRPTRRRRRGGSALARRRAWPRKCVAAEPFERVGDAGRGLGQHRARRAGRPSG